MNKINRWLFGFKKLNWHRKKITIRYMAVIALYFDQDIVQRIREICKKIGSEIKLVYQTQF